MIGSRCFQSLEMVLSAMWKFIKMLIGLGLIPLCWAISVAVYQLYNQTVTTELSTHMEAWALPIGFLIWVVIFFLLPRPVRTYVLGHELTHALWALMMGGRVGKMKVGKSGGHVELSKTNFLITLSPYFFPFYTVILIAVYYLLGLKFDLAPYRIWWLAGVGLTWSFHITFTISMLAEHQPDVQEHGRIFSHVIIYGVNILVIGLWMVLIGAPEMDAFGQQLGQEISTVYTLTWSYILFLYDQVSEGLHALRSGQNETTAYSEISSTSGAIFLMRS
ncbi:hypothetical protein P4B35_14665 [Pontiellaceae bacterium B12227]|nr:hypothetical protein [Pontiellaceae bacterium B12227]